MEAIKQSVRPKHQVLILKCYPRLPKNSSAAEIKPKGSELSYLLYYASSRRSKLSKVGAFLEKKVIHDLWKGRTAPVQITLQILSAFLNNPAIGGTGAQGFGLFAPYILRIIREVLKDANEAILVEAAVPTWDGFCKHQDHITLSADPEFYALFAEVVSLWAGYATKEQVQPNRTSERRGKMRVGVTDNVKLRMAGLLSLKSIADSDTLVSDAGRQLDTVMPVILQNLYDGDGDLDQIMELNAEMETQEKEKGKARPSMTATKDADHDDGDARAAGRTVAEADRLADQEASILALRCLKAFFSFESRTQVRSATMCVLRFILAHRPNPIKFKQAQNHEEEEYQWAVQLFKTLCSWVPVQDRFAALFTAVEMLISSPVAQDDLYRQVLLARIISHLLASDVNLIGLSIMDVLLGLLRHMVNVISEGSRTSATNGTSDVNSTNDSHHSAALSTKQGGAETPMVDGEPRKTPIRTRLLFQLQQCISNLAVHVYYTDQISDMIIAILLRLRPSNAAQSSNLQVPARQISVSISGSQGVADDSSPAHSDAGVSNSSHRHDSRQMAGISFNSAVKRETALNAICSILTCANDSSRGEMDYVATNRNPVPMSVWEGSQWLMKEPEESVRVAYVRAFTAWLDLELPKLALDKALQEEKKLEREWKRKSLNSDLARRAANTASARKAANKRTQTAILQAVHLTTVDLLAIVEKDGATTNGTASGTSASPVDYTPSISPVPTHNAHAEMCKLAAKLHKISTQLDLMDLEEFRNLQPPALPIYPPSPKQPSSMLAPNHNHGNHTPDSEGDYPSRRPSNATSLSNLKRAAADSNGRTRSLSGARRSTSLTGASGGGRMPSVSASNLARPPSASRLPGTSARHDFASNPSSSGRVSPAPAQVEELKRLLAASSAGSPRSSSLTGLGLTSSSSGAASSSAVGVPTAAATAGVGAGNAVVARRAVNNPAGTDTETTGSESMVEIEGSWAGTSFATPERSRDRERDAKRVDVRALLESLPTGEDEVGVGEGGPPL